MNIKTKILEFNRRDIRGHSIRNLDLDKTNEKLRRQKILVKRNFDYSKPVGLVNNIEIIDNSLFANMKLLDSIDLGSLTFAFGGTGEREKIDEQNYDYFNVILTEVGLIDKDEEVPYV